jgi:uncharacterized protein YecE (DUF72 family)
VDAKSLIKEPLPEHAVRVSHARHAGVGALHVGTAGWSIPSAHAREFPQFGTHLQRYATRLNAVEINSSFYRPHRKTTYERWADSVPPGFRFAVKTPREITHEHALRDCTAPLARFTLEVAGLGERLGVILVQLPPSLVFEARIASFFFRELRKRFDAQVGMACEPRHDSWFTARADELLTAAQVARVAADPPRASAGGQPGGWRELAYFRLHGAPHVYYSNYDVAALERIGTELTATAARASSAWCIFDNTAAQAAIGNAMAVQAMAPRIAGAA